MRLLYLSLASIGVLNAQLVVSDLGGTQTQHVFSLTGYTGACTIKVSKTPVTFNPLIPDVDGTKYSGSSTDTGRVDTIIQPGGAHIVTIGHQIYDRPLAADTQYFWEVSGCGTTTSGNFTTPTLALQTTQSWPVPFDPNTWNNTAYPVTTFADTLDKTSTHVDPISGTEYKVASTPVDFTWRYPGGGRPSPTAGTVKFAYVDGGAGWTNPLTIVNGATSTASTTNQNPIDLYMDKFNDLQLDDAYATIGGGYNDFGVKLFGSATTGDNFNACIFWNPLDGCVSTGFTVTPPATVGTPLIVGSGSDPDNPFPTNFPCTFYCGWGTGVTVPAEHRLTYGTLTASAGVITLAGTIGEINHLSTALKNGNKIFIQGSSPTCTNNLCTISSLVDSGHANLVENLTIVSPANYVAMGFGVRITKSATAGTLNIGAEFKIAGSIKVMGGYGATFALCNNNSFATGDVPPKQARICSVPAKGVRYYYFLMDDMTARPMNSGVVPDSSYFTGTLGWSPNDVPNTLNYGGAGGVPGTNPRDWYVYLGNSVGGANIYKLHYRGDTTENSNFNYTMAYGGDAYILNAPSNNIDWSLVTSSTNTVISQITTNYPSYDTTMFGTSFSLSGISGDTIYFQNEYNGGQNLGAYIAAMDISSGTGVLTNLFETVGGVGIGGQIRFGGLHNLGASNLLSGSAQVSLHALTSSDTTKLLSGPFTFPITGVQRGGVWSTNTCLSWPTSDTTFCGIAAADSDCGVLAPGNPYTGHGGTGANCAKIRFPHGGFCNTSPRADELAKWPCPSPTTPIAGWTPTSYSQPFPIQVGDVFFGNAVGDIFGEELLVAAYFSASEPDGQDSAVIIRNSPADDCCIAGYNRPDQLTCQNNPSTQGQHLNGWMAVANVKSLDSCADTSVFMVGNTSSATVSVQPHSIGGHNDIISGLVTGTASWVGSAGAMVQAPVANLFDIPFSRNPLTIPLFHGRGGPVGGNGMQSYSDGINSNPWFTDGNTVNNNFGSATENAQNGGSIVPFTRDITNVSGDIWIMEMACNGSGLLSCDFKTFFPIGWAGQHNLVDVSGPASSSVAALAGTPYSFCLPEVANGECFAGSTVGAVGTHGFRLVYINVPHVYAQPFCVNGVHYANIPCVISGWTGAGAFRQQGWTTADSTSAHSRFLTYYNDYPGSQYAYNQIMPLSASVSWGPPTFVGGWGQVQWLSKNPTWYSGTSVAGDFIPTNVTLGAGSQFARIKFGYSRFIGPNNAADSGTCSTRGEACVTGGSPYSWISESNTPATSIWAPTGTPTNPFFADGNPVTLAVKFSSSVNGQINGVKFYKGVANTGTHTGLLYDNSGTELARATFTGETASGWQSVSFGSPIAITPGLTYYAAYTTIPGYARDLSYFASSSFVNYPFTATGSAFQYGSSPTFPTNPSTTNYWVDIDFTQTGTCTSGCTIPVPVMAPNITYITPQRSSDNVTWVDGVTSVLINSGVQVGACSDLVYSPLTATPASGGGTGTITLTVTDQTCASVNTSNQSWLTITGASGGCSISGGRANCTGNGTFNWAVTANVGPSRVGSINPDSATSSFTATQASGCTFGIVPTSFTYSSAGGGQGVTITASDPTCGWTTTYPDSWLSGPASGTGSGLITVTASANGGGLRTSSPTIATQTFSATQLGTISPGTKVNGGATIGGQVKVN